MTKKLLFSFLLLFQIAFSQELHHQMISSQGKNASLTNGVIVSQTIGQQSVTGTSQNGLITQQGFQQSNWGKIIALNNQSTIVTTTYPNPFVDNVNFQFTNAPSTEINVEVYDILGRIISRESLLVTSNKSTIDLRQLPSAEYLIKITAPNYTYFTKIIKK